MLKKLLILLLISLLISPIIASPNVYTEVGYMEVSIEQTQSNFLQTFFNYFRLWESNSQIRVSWVTFEKDLGGDLSKYNSPDSYKLFEAYQLGCTIKTEFAVRNTATSVNYGNIKDTNVYEMSSTSGWKAESLGFYSVPDGNYEVSAITSATCPSGVSNPMATYKVGGLFYKSGTIQIGTPPPISCADGDVGDKCGEVYVELVCRDGDVYEEFEVWKYNSDCDCVFDSYWYDLHESCDYGCTENVYGASCDPAPVCTTIEEECKREFVENFCKGNDIYKKEAVYQYDSNCNCVYESLDESFVKSCPYGCSNGLCLSQPVKKSDGESCDTNTDCTSGLCLDEGVCGPIGYECWTNAGCGAGETCIYGKCEAVCTPHCEGFYWWDCENNMPVNKEILIDKCGVKCISDGDCLSDYVCDGYVCVEKIGWKSFGEFCTSDDECISGYCLDSEVVCVPAGWVCYTEAGCMFGYDCINGECIEERIPPIDDGDGGFEGLKPIGVTCYSDSECVSYNCIENICVVAGIECITDTGCGVNEMCSEGKCIPVPEFPSWVFIVVGGLIIGIIIIVMFLILKK